MRLDITRYLNNIIANGTHETLAKNTPNTEQVQSETLIRVCTRQPEGMRVNVVLRNKHNSLHYRMLRHSNRTATTMSTMGFLIESYQLTTKYSI